MSGAHRVLIADDEAPARHRIRALLAERTRYVIAGESDTGRSTLDAIHKVKPDLTFLDVQMPDLNGLEVLEQLETEARPVIIFTTAYEQYALDAFDAHAIDYLLKPYTDERFDAALERAEQLLQSRQVDEWRDRLAQLLRVIAAAESDPLARARPIERFAVRHRDRVTVIGVADVDWIQASRDYLELHVGKARHLVRMTMQEVEGRLDTARYVRIHRSAIVQVDRVVGLEPYSGSEDVVVLRDGTKLRVSRAYRRAVRQRLGIE